MIRFSNNSVFEQLSTTNCVCKPRFDCRSKTKYLCVNEENDKTNSEDGGYESGKCKEI